MPLLPLASARRTDPAASRLPWAAWYAAVAAAVLSLGAGFVHLAYVESHWDEWWAYGVFFLASGVFQLVYSVIVLRWPGPRIAMAGIVANLGIVVMYFYSRTEGIPIGPHSRVKEHVEAVDLATTAGEIGAAAALLLLVGARTRRWVVNILLAVGVALWVVRLRQDFA